MGAGPSRSPGMGVLRRVTYRPARGALVASVILPHNEPTSGLMCRAMDSLS